MKQTLGTCYYPEQWPEEMWETDAKRMASVGLTWVRIGEFSWHKLEPTRGVFNWQWLDTAIEILGDAGLKVMLGTPTATPPRWMLDRHPDMLAVDIDGKPRKFGSRRHYCFSHEGYKTECARIIEAIAARYGNNPHVCAWQTDNEYGCHDTTLSYSNAARIAFQHWLTARYETIDNLNAAWGNVFWSMTYDQFDQIDLPNMAVTEVNPAHALAFRRFSSDQVVGFNKVQTDIIKKYSTAPVSHNYMGRITDFDHFEVGEDLDFATWDSYPLGFLEDRVDGNDDHKSHFSQQGDPDFQAFHHDLYRAVGRGRWWVMEQQPGPVNWAPYNPRTAARNGAVMDMEAFAHGAEAVCYFRWRQAPFAQEQMHAGLLRPDSADATGMAELREVAAEIAAGPETTVTRAKVAILFDYDADFSWKIQPHGAGLSYFRLVFEIYKAMRGLGLSIDILPVSTRDFSGYGIVAAPGLMHLPDDLKTALCACDAQVLLGPRTAARNVDMAIPVPLPPNMPGMDITVTYVESMRPGAQVPLVNGGNLELYRETLTGGGDVLEQTMSGEPVVIGEGNLTYIGAWLDEEALSRVVLRSCDRADIETLKLPNGVRIRDTKLERFTFNYNPHTVKVGHQTLKAAGVLREPILIG